MWLLWVKLMWKSPVTCLGTMKEARHELVEDPDLVALRQPLVLHHSLLLLRHMPTAHIMTRPHQQRSLCPISIVIRALLYTVFLAEWHSEDLLLIFFFFISSDQEEVMNAVYDAGDAPLEAPLSSAWHFSSPTLCSFYSLSSMCLSVSILACWWYPNILLTEIY